MKPLTGRQVGFARITFALTWAVHLLSANLLNEG
jgi:hypothetical protein